MSLLDAAGVVTGDIWCSGAFSFESPLKDLLDSGEYTLEQLLAEDELLQELRGMHPQLIEFLSSEESVAGLLQYVILPPGAPPPKTFASVSSHCEFYKREFFLWVSFQETKGRDRAQVRESSCLACWAWVPCWPRNFARAPRGNGCQKKQRRVPLASAVDCRGGRAGHIKRPEENDYDFW